MLSTLAHERAGADGRLLHEIRKSVAGYCLDRGAIKPLAGILFSKAFQVCIRQRELGGAAIHANRDPWEYKYSRLRQVFQSGEMDADLGGELSPIRGVALQATLQQYA